MLFGCFLLVHLGGVSAPVLKVEQPHVQRMHHKVEGHPTDIRQRLGRAAFAECGCG